jgi:hypothetical protein
MAHEPKRNQERVQANVAALNFLTSEELREIAGITPSTEENWRKRGTGPAYVLFGTQYLYPRQAVQDHLESLVRARGVSAKGML